tara:strand:- start:334 stop:441 length:108 start_codon:yes stop_codon:yes gene_type:complete
MLKQVQQDEKYLAKLKKSHKKAAKSVDLLLFRFDI